MKRWLTISVLPLILFGTACSRSINLASHGDQLAPALGENVSDLRFMHYCGFNGELSASNDQRVRLMPGIVVLTKDQLLFVKETDLSNLRASAAVRIPLAEIEGISNRESQMTLRYGGQEWLIVIAEKRAKPDPDGTQDLFWLLASEGIARYQNAGLYATTWDLYWNMFVEGPKFRWGLPQDDGIDSIRY